MSADEHYRNELLSHLANAVEQVQIEQVSEGESDDLGQVEPYISNDSPSGQILFSYLEVIFTHGLKNKNQGIWEAVQYFCRHDVVCKVHRLHHVVTNIGRGRAWIYLALNENNLEGYLHSFQMNLSHMYRYYQRSAMICGKQVSLLQALITGLDSVNFKLILDVAYLDFSIKCNKNWSNLVSNSSKTTDRTTNHGSVVHIDTRSITSTGKRAASLVKGIFSRKGSTVEKSLENVETLSLVAVNANRTPMQGKIYCPDCKSPMVLVCFCIKEEVKISNTSVPSTSAMILEDALSSENGGFQDSSSSSLGFDATNSSVPYFKQRGNPFDCSCEELNSKPVLRRINQELSIVDSPVEVIRKRTKRRKKYSDTASDVLTRSEDIFRSRNTSELSVESDGSERLESFSDCLCLGNPLIGFDPEKDNVTHEDISSSVKNVAVGVAHNPQAFNYNTKRVNNHSKGVISNAEGVNEMCNKQLTQTNTTAPVVVSSRDSLSNDDKIAESSTANTESPSRNAQTIIEAMENLLDTAVDRNMNNVTTDSDLCRDEKVDEVVAEMEGESVGQGELFLNDLTSEKRPNLVKSDNTEKRPDLVKSDNSEKGPNLVKSDNSENRSDLVKSDNSEKGPDSVKTDNSEKRPDLVKSDNSEPETDCIENLAEKGSKTGEFENSEYNFVSKLEISGKFEHEPKIPTTSSSARENICSEKLNFPDTGHGHPMEGKENIRKSKRTRRCHSESELLLNDSTRKEVERLMVEIQMKLKPSQEKLKKVRKPIAEKNQYQRGSLQHDSIYIVEREWDSGLSSITRPLPDDARVDGIEHDPVSFIGQDLDLTSTQRECSSLHCSSSSSNSVMIPGTESLHPLNSDTPDSHKKVVKIDNLLKLYLMLEILVSESEEIIKLFHVSTGHSEGHWTALYLLFSDSCLYFLRSSDGNCPYRTEHIMGYEDLDYTSVGFNNQMIEFVFYTREPKSSSKGKGMRGRLRTKVLIDTCEKDLTDLIIATLSKTVQVFTRRHSVLSKVCPPVFHDAREHQISLIKYLRSERLTGDIQLYQLVHWEDPNFTMGANISKVSLEGTLKYRSQTFWRSSWRSAYFVLSGGILYQYKNKDGEKPETSHQLTGNSCVGCKRIHSGSSGRTSSWEFEVNFQDGSKLELCGFSDVEVTEWLQCLCMIVSLDQSSTIDRGAATDGTAMNMLNHDALVPCGLIIADETLLLCHEDQRTGFCRTLAKAQRQDITAVNIDREKSFVCEVVVELSAEERQKSKWGIFFPDREPLEGFLAVINSFLKAPTLNDKDDDFPLAHYLEARTLLDNRWTRSDNLLKGRVEG